jgi:hypothetical protein
MRTTKPPAITSSDDGSDKVKEFAGHVGYIRLLCSLRGI